MYSGVEKLIKDIFPLKTKENIEKPSPLILGLSGGPDSMALFHILKKLQEKYSFYLVSAHVNHMFRGAQADGEEEHLKKTLSESGDIIESLRIDVTEIARREKLSNQDAGHRVRREFFTKLASKYGAKYIALAHHGDDRVESYFIHLFHGAGVQGLSALSPLGDYGNNLKVVRPLMSFSKEEILEFCKKEDIFYFKDPSNEKPHYKRNKIRLELIPLLEKEYNSNIKKIILGSMEILEDENAYLEKITEEEFQKLVKKEENKFLLNREGFRQLNIVLQRRLIIYILKSEKINYNRQKIEKILSLLNIEKGQQSYDLSEEWSLEVTYNEACFIKVEDKAEPSIFSKKIPSTILKSIEPRVVPKITEGEPVTLTQGNLEFTFSLESFEDKTSDSKESPEVLWLDKELLENKENPLTLRTRQEGDMIKPSKGKRKTLKKYLIEKKIPSNQRDNLILLAQGKEIIWIPNLTFSQDYVLNKDNLKQSEKNMLKVVCKAKESLKNNHQCDKVY